MPIDLSLLLRAYAMGIFPMADSRDDPEIFWVEPKKRAVLPLDQFHMSASLRKVVRSDRFTVTADCDFAGVIQACGAVAEDRPETWINGQIEDACLRLHHAGHAHSVECWRDGRLVGGLYGIALGRAFFGESMFSRETDASKVALAWLVARLRVGGFTLLDCQFMTDHLRSLGAIEISQEEYLQVLGEAVAGVTFGAGADGSVASDGGAAFSTLDSLGADPDAPPTLTVSSPISGQFIAQLLTQTS